MSDLKRDYRAHYKALSALSDYRAIDVLVEEMATRIDLLSRVVDDLNSMREDTKK